MNRLDTIVVRERKLRARDLAFAAFIALVAAFAAAGIVSVLDSAPR